MADQPLVCQVCYRLDPARLAEFEAYALVWIDLIERHGGTHLGYFMPRAAPEQAPMSFPDTGRDGEGVMAVALFSFPDEASYLDYRQKVASDSDGQAANARFGMHPPFISYERHFLTPLLRPVETS